MTTVDSESVTVQATVTVFDVYQPLVPAVPVMVLVMPGGVVSLAAPVPLTVAEAVLQPPCVQVMLMVADFAPTDCGVKLTVKGAVLSGALLDPSIWRIEAGVTEKLELSEETMVTALAVVPLLVIVNVLAVPLDPTFTVPKLH